MHINDHEPQDTNKYYTRHEKILYGSSFGQLCYEENIWSTFRIGYLIQKQLMNRLISLQLSVSVMETIAIAIAMSASQDRLHHICLRTHTGPRQIMSQIQLKAIANTCFNYLLPLPDTVNLHHSSALFVDFVPGKMSV